MNDDYFNVKGFISASFIKELSNNPKEAYSIIMGKESKKTPALIFGSLVDCLLTTPDKFTDNYAIYNGKKPKDKLLDFANKYIEIYQSEASTGDFSVDSTILRARTESGYDSRLLNDTVIKKFKDECEDYCNFHIDNSEKIIIDNDTLSLANQLVSSVKLSPYLEHLFYPSNDHIILFQVPLYVTTTKFEGKALLDIVDINLSNKTITPWDIKTFEGSFESNYWKYKYYYQEVWYSFLLETLKNPDFFVDCKIPEELNIIHSGEFNIEQFKFIAIDKSLYKEVEIFVSYKEILEDVMFKGIINKGDYNIHIKPIEKLINEAKERFKLDNWSTDYEMLTNGIKKLWL